MKKEKKVEQVLLRSAENRRGRTARRRGRRKRNQQSLHLPEEIIEEEILSRLPVKSLLRLRCVSKTWRSLIGSKRFIKAHHQNSIKNSCFPHQRVITLKNTFEECSLQSLQSERPISRDSPDDLVITTLLPFVIWGCYNGLFCVLKKSSEQPSGLDEKPRRIYLWNPSTRSSKKLPEISDPGYAKNYGFGWVESSDEYKVFVSVFYRKSQVGKVYSSKTKSWKTIELRSDLAVCCRDGVFAGGKLYWKNYGGDDHIIFLDLKSEVFGRIELPFQQRWRRKGCLVGVVGGFHCVTYYFDERDVQLWVMKESWKKVATLANLVELLLPAPVPLVVAQNREILVNCGSSLLVYDRGDNTFRSTEFCFRFRTRVYVESLVSPKDV